MAGGGDQGDKTERPTPKRLADAARKGDVLASRDLAAALVMSAGALWLFTLAPALIEALSAAIRDALSFDAGAVRGFDPGGLARRIAMRLLPPIAGLAGMAMVAAIAATALLGSFGFRGQAFAFKGSRINPLSGMKRIFGAQGLVELGKSLAKVGAIGAVGIFALKGQIERIASPVAMDVHQAAAGAGDSLRWTVALLCAALAGIAMVDVPAQIMQRTRRLRMSRQELRDEHKQTEGSPEVKANQRQRRHAILSRSVRQAVEEASVVLTNPTHFAVALRYRPDRDAAPLVVARGRGATAQAIRELAREKDVPVLGYPRLARAIYYTSREGQGIAEDLYMAVAVVLAFVFGLDARLRAGATAGPPVKVPPDYHFDSDGRRETPGR